MSMGSYDKKTTTKTGKCLETFYDNRKHGSNLQPYRKQNSIFQANKNFNKTSTKPYVPPPNGNNKVASGANATYLAIKC